MEYAETQAKVQKGALQANNAAINQLIGEEGEKLTHTRFIGFKQGKASLSLASQASAQQVTHAMDQHRQVIPYGNWLYVHPSLGLERGRKIDVEDENGEIRTFIIEHFTKAQLIAFTIAINNYLFPLVLQQQLKEGEKKDKKDDQKLVDDNRITSKLEPNAIAKENVKESSTEAPSPEGKITKEQEEKFYELKANRLKKSKMQDEKVEEINAGSVKAEEKKKDKRNEDIKGEGLVKERQHKEDSMPKVNKKPKKM